jgi:zinc transport system permease protein
MSLLSLFHHDFVLRSFLAGMLIATIAPSIGLFLVVRRYSFLADTLSHVSLAGVTIGSVLGINPLLCALACSLGTAFSLEILGKQRRSFEESGLILFLSGGLALSAVLLSFSKGNALSLSALLFGSIATVSQSDLFVMSGLAGIILLFLTLLFPRLFAIALSSELALVSGMNTRLIHTIFLCLTSLTIVLSLPMVGALLLSALMVIPVLTALRFGTNFKHTLFLSVGFSLGATVIGLLLSLLFELSSGGSIVLTSIVLFLFAHFFLSFSPFRK